MYRCTVGIVICYAKLNRVNTQLLHIHKWKEWNREKKLHLSLQSAQFLAVSLQAPFQSYENFCKITKGLLLH